MIDWEEIIKTESVEELKEAKLWLFRENMRLQNERKELDAAHDKFLKERVSLRNELDELNRRTVMERRRMKEESLFFDKKMEILKAGFQDLERDRKAFEQEKKNLTEERIAANSTKEKQELEANIVMALFRNVNNSLALRKRYRDLVKIFHPDNLFGDAELMQSINKEFVKRKEEL